MDIVSLIMGYAQENPKVASALIIMAGLRMVLKPIQDAAHWYVAQTADPEDDKKLEEVEQSKWFKGLSWLLDYAASVKLPPKKQDASVP